MPRTVYPILQYRDPRAAIDWLQRAFGFEPAVVHESPDGGIGHAELHCGEHRVMLSGAAYDDGAHLGRGWCYVVVADADAHHARAAAAGAEIVTPPTDLEYGSRDYGARDPEGNRWSFGTYTPG